MNETIACPVHGEQPSHVDADGFTSCRRCWYREWLIVLLPHFTRSWWRG